MLLHYTVLPPRILRERKHRTKIPSRQQQELFHAQDIDVRPLARHRLPEGAQKWNLVGAGHDRGEGGEVGCQSCLRFGPVAHPHAVEEPFPELEEVEGC